MGRALGLANQPARSELALGISRKRAEYGSRGEGRVHSGGLVTRLISVGAVLGSGVRDGKFSEGVGNTAGGFRAPFSPREGG